MKLPTCLDLVQNLKLIGFLAPPYFLFYGFSQRQLYLHADDNFTMIKIRIVFFWVFTPCDFMSNAVRPFESWQSFTRHNTIQNYLRLFYLEKKHLVTTTFFSRLRIGVSIDFIFIYFRTHESDKFTSQLDNSYFNIPGT